MDGIEIRIALKHVLDVGIKRTLEHFGIVWLNNVFFRKLITSQKSSKQRGVSLSGGWILSEIWWTIKRVVIFKSLYSFFFFYNWAKSVQKCIRLSNMIQKRKKCTLHFVFLFLAGGWCRRFLESYDIMAFVTKKNVYSLNARESLAPLALWAASLTWSAIVLLVSRVRIPARGPFKSCPFSIPPHFLLFYDNNGKTS